MRAINTKLVRDLQRLWPQATAISLVVACGVATLILAIGSYRSLDETRRAYYERHHFADIFAHATRAPQSLEKKISQINGVMAAETRIVEPMLLDILGMSEPGAGQVISLPDSGGSRLNQIFLQTGRLPQADKPGEVVVTSTFAKEHDFNVGSTFHGILKGRRVDFKITGLALSPEFIYTIGPGDLVPDHRRFAVLWMSEHQIAAIAGLEDAFNAVSLTLLPKANVDAVVNQLDRILAPYGGIGAYPRKDQISHAFLDGELQQLKAMARVIPPIFLFVSAFLVNMILARLINLEREEIGLLKALGYHRWEVASHYVKLVVLITTVGIIIGFIAGTWLGIGLTKLFSRFYHFPFLIFTRSVDIYILAAGITLCAALLGAMKSVIQAASLTPANAMQAAAPPLYRKASATSKRISRHFSELTIMVIRHITRWPIRFGITTLGVSLAVALLVTAFFTSGSVNHMIDNIFFLTHRQDATISFSTPLGPESIHNVQQMPGVMYAEPYRIELVEITHGTHSRRVSLTGKHQPMNLSRVLNNQETAVDLPATGLVLTERLSSQLEAVTGDTVQIRLMEEGAKVLAVPVVDIVSTYLGLEAYMDLGALDQLSRLGPRRSGAYVMLDENRVDENYELVKSTPMVMSLSLQKTSLKKFRETVEQNINIMTTVYVVLSVIIAFGVVYNSQRIQLSERARELASLRVFGFTRMEVSSVLIIELAVVAILAQPLGWLLGSGFSWAVVQGFESDLYRLPFHIEKSTFGWSSTVVLIATIISAVLVLIRVRKLNMIKVLKSRE